MRCQGFNLWSHFLSHSILIANLADDAHSYTIQLQLEGIVCYFECILPTYAITISITLLFKKTVTLISRDAWFCCKKWWPLLDAEVGTGSADKDHKEESYYKLSQVSLQYEASDVTDIIV